MTTKLIISLLILVSLSGCGKFFDIGDMMDQRPEDYEYEENGSDDKEAK